MADTATDEITWGETYSLEITARDAVGSSIVMDGTWSVAVRVVTSSNVLVEDLTVSIVGGKAVASIDTGDEPWSPGIYKYDVRITDPDGNDQWSEQITLKIKSRITPAT